MKTGARITIRGIVQGVGFRPFAYELAARCGVRGSVRNDSLGVEIAAFGEAVALDEFVERLRSEPPPAARIYELRVEPVAYEAREAFVIETSAVLDERFVPLSPDLATCADCVKELFDPDDRRYRYPFINCTHCGPRFTIIRDIPYDRPKTTMDAFPMCADCEREYRDPADRRFHAQPNACPVCGPRITLLDATGADVGCDDPVRTAVDLLLAGKVVAVKGLGGYHLACDATSDAAVGALRSRKWREDKPFAVMMRSLDEIERYCLVDETAKALLTSVRAPIVLLEKRDAPVRKTAGRGRPALQPGDAPPLSDQVAPMQQRWGVMLPYTPLHHLLLDGARRPLVMTSGNVSDEPIAFRNDDALARLRGIADASLVHNREIRTRCDDSVTSVFRGRPYVLRRSRGAVPEPLILPVAAPKHVLAVGGELKNAFCFARDTMYFLSQHIGDLENVQTLAAFEDGVAHLSKLLYADPEIIIYDRHPDYLATKWALSREGVRKLGIQHHHAQVLSCVAECLIDDAALLDEQVIGVAFDGSGYGDDGRIWGGEFLVFDALESRRVAHLDEVPMPGGAKAIKEPWRMAVAHLRAAFGERMMSLGIPFVDTLDPVETDVLVQMIEKSVNAPWTSSMGRLFDAVSATAGVRRAINYEGQAAIELEYYTDASMDGAYPFSVEQRGDGALVVSPAPMFEALVDEIKRGEPVPVLSTRFHNGVARMLVEVCERIRDAEGLNSVALSGGVFQNRYLLTRAVAQLEADGFRVLTHSRVPANDGGLALGQALHGAAVVARRG
ncbi:MAG: carbamoyltransferase HypF [Verrucomicrobia bacterium]|nr:carbamoyltransferase HypF [Verrucomicrobiota bacterium]